MGSSLKGRATATLLIALIVAAATFLPPPGAGTATAKTGVTSGASDRIAWIARTAPPGRDEAVSLARAGPWVFVTGTSSGDYRTIAYEAATGRLVWERAYDGPAKGEDTTSAVASDGKRVYVTGQSGGGDESGSEYATVAYDAATGSRLWVARYAGPLPTSGDWATAVDADGSRVYVTGGSHWGSGTEYATIAYDAATGSMVWIQRVRRDDRINVASAIRSDGSAVYVTGMSEICDGGCDGMHVTVAYRATTGSQLWVRRHGVHRDCFCNSFLAVKGNRVYVAGTLGGRETYRVRTVAYDKRTGVRVWARTSATARDEDDFVAALRTDGARVYVTGDTYTFKGDRSVADYATVAYDGATGKLRWYRTFGGRAHGNDIPSAIATDGTSVFVTGHSAGPNGYDDYATVAYDARTGRTVWVMRYNGRANRNDRARSIRTDGKRIYVTGMRAGDNSGFDYATIAYRDRI